MTPGAVAHRLSLTIALASAGPLAAQPAVLSTPALRAEFGPRGLVSLTELAGRRAYRFTRDDFRLRLDGREYASAALAAPARSAGRQRVTYTWTAGRYRVEVVYELASERAFLSKQLLVTGTPADGMRVDEVEVLAATLAESPADVFVIKSPFPRMQTGDYGGALRFADGRGLLAVAQNPFLSVRRDGSSFSLSYAPDMEWRAAYGAFASDRALLAPYRLTGRRLAATMLPEWKLGDPAAAADTSGLDVAEVDAFTEMVRAFLLYRPDRPANVFVGWTANDYQIDIATPEGRAEYKHLLDRAAALGAEHVVFAPTNSALSRRVESADEWSWENLLWLGLGQKMRKGEWDPRRDSVPASVREMLDHARSRRLGLLAYVYPVVPFAQNPQWLVPARRDTSRRLADLGVRSLQDWLIEKLVAFKQRTEVTGYAFDHTFLTLKGTSTYAQWWGWRRVMEELRRRFPDVVVDGRQAYHLYGPWSWLAGSYPHPTLHDEQPESFTPFPDLHFDRVSANRQRFTAYHYRNHEFAPSEIVPGFMTHQTPRLDDTGDMPQVRTDRDVFPVRFRARDWDYLGWRYSVLSSIATGGWNNVLSMIPARDSAERVNFAERDQQWLRGWVEWTNRHRELLRNTRTILGQPALGKVDGTSAVGGNRGFVFLFNPNARRIGAELALDETIGLIGPGPYLLRELHPLAGRLVGKPGAGVWGHADRVSLSLDGATAMVLEVEPAPQPLREPLLFNAPGTAALAGGALRLTDVRGEVGADADLLVLLPRGRTASTAQVNGRDARLSRSTGDAVSIAVRFDGERFGRLQQVGSYDPDFRGGTFSGALRVPRRVFDQLAARRRAWPIPWTAEDYRTTWLAPERLLLFVQIAEPDHRWEARLTIDGRLVELRKA